MNSFGISNIIKNITRPIGEVKTTTDLGAIKGVEIESPIDVLVTSNNLNRYEVKGMPYFLFVRMSRMDGVSFFEIEGGENINAADFYKIHLAYPYPLDPIQTVEKRMSHGGYVFDKKADKWLNNSIKNADDFELVNRIGLVYLSKCQLHDLTGILNWKRRILDSLSSLIGKSGDIEFPVVGVFPDSSNFLKRTFRSIGGKTITKIDFDNRVIIPSLEKGLFGSSVCAMVVTSNHLKEAGENASNFIVNEKSSIERKWAQIESLSQERVAEVDKLKIEIEQSGRREALTKLLNQ